MSRPFVYTELQEAWLHDLEHTRVKQGKGKLHQYEWDRHTYCCLGRACKVLKIPNDGTVNIFDGAVFKYLGKDSVLPALVQDRLCLYHDNGSDTTETNCLAEMNDAGMSFKNIAKAIRATPWRYFHHDARGREDNPSV